METRLKNERTLRRRRKLNSAKLCHCKNNVQISERYWQFHIFVALKW